jgi:hypothetical protein
MMKNVIISVLLICIITVVSSQQDFLRNYKPLECKGEFPQDFKYSFFERFEKDVETISHNLKSKKKKRFKGVLFKI